MSFKTKQKPGQGQRAYLHRKNKRRLHMKNWKEAKDAKIRRHTLSVSEAKS